LSKTLLAFWAASVLQAQSIPSWWNATLDAPRLESRFVQQSESAVFGSLKRQGTLQLAKGGRIRVAYGTGLLLVADGATLIQYDPAARTAQRFNLRSAASDMPLLNVLLNPRALGASYRIVPAGADRVHLEPLRKGLPAVELEGRGAFLRAVNWTDSTGAKQRLELTDPRTPPAAFPASVFTFQAPVGTRWLGQK
jgi:outer membrane lipoprotein-sorting protein